MAAVIYVFSNQFTFYLGCQNECCMGIVAELQQAFLRIYWLLSLFPLVECNERSVVLKKCNRARLLQSLGPL